MARTRVADRTAPFDAAITTLARARSLHPRLDALAGVIFHLHGVRQHVPSRKLPSRDPIPLPLRWYHANYADHPRILGGSDQLFPLDALEPDANGFTTFLAESDGCFLLACRDRLTDPIVWGNERNFHAAEDWSREDITLSEALAAHVLSDFAMCAKVQLTANRARTPSLLTATQDLLYLPFGWRTAWNLHLWAGRGVVVAAIPSTPGSRKGDPWDWAIFAAARRRAELAFLSPILNSPP